MRIDGRKPGATRQSRRACKRCGTNVRYASNGHCVECRKRHDSGRKRKGKRDRCETILRFQYGYGNIHSMSRAERDYLIGLHFPLMRPWLLKRGVRWWEGGKALEVPIPF